MSAIFINSFQPGVVFCVETSILIFKATQMTGFCMEWNTAPLKEPQVNLQKVDPGPLEQADPTQKFTVSVKNSFLTNLRWQISNMTIVV